jgi:hypothetical protein
MGRAIQFVYFHTFYVYMHMVYTFRVNWFKKTIENTKEFAGHPRRHIHALVVVTILTLILGSITLFFATNKSLESKERNNLQAVTELNNSVGNITIDTTQRARYEVMQQSNQLKEVSDQSETFKIVRAAAIETTLHNSSATSVNDDADKISESVNNLAQNSNQIALEIAALDKYLQYNPAADFALLGQDDSNDAERIERALTAFKELLNGSLLSDSNQDVIKQSIVSFNEFKTSKNLDDLTTNINAQQLQIISNLDKQINELKSSFNSFYNSIIYQ